MSKPLGFEKPLGMRDFLPQNMKKRRLIDDKLRHCITKWGYQEIMTPTLEYDDTVGGASTTLDDKLFKLLDRQGKTVVLRPDMTGPIARVTSSLLQDTPLPLRLFYQSNVFRVQENEAGRNAEFFQTGVELIGEQDVAADAEMIALAVAGIRASGISSFKLVVGHMGFLDGLFEEIVADEQDRKALKQRLEEHDYVGYRNRVAGLTIDDRDKARLDDVLQLRGSDNVMEKALQLTTNGRAKQAVETLAQLKILLKAYDVMEHVVFDFNLISHLDYYTGILFEGYTDGLGFPICSGGRYDDLLARFGRPAPATGFALHLDWLVQCSSLSPSEDEQHVLLVYPKDQREAAIKEASRLREQTNVTVSMKCVTDEQAEVEDEKRYDQVIHLDGGEKE